MNDGGYVRGAVFIGRYCSIGRRVSIGAANHLATGMSTSPAVRGSDLGGYSEEERLELFGSGARLHATSTVVGNDVWIGDGAVLLEGVQLGTGCIVGANAVVTRTVEPYAVVAGLPARRLRTRFPDEVVERLLRSQWWNLPPAYLRSLPTSHVVRTLERLEADAADAATCETFIVEDSPPAEK
jgi:acetyltransferase-like isoleucine patch superfamily enzyme